MLISGIGAHQAGRGDDAGAGLAVCRAVDPGLSGLEIIVGADGQSGAVRRLVQDRAIGVSQVRRIDGARLRVADHGLAVGVDKEHEGNLEEWDVVIDTNIRALLSMTRLVVPGMVERGCGHIINIGSIAGDAAYPGGSVYCATKAAVKALSDGLRIDLVDTPLRVTNIKPGLVETNFSVVRFRGDQQKADNVYKGIKALSGEDIAEVAYFAASAPEHMQVAEILVMPTNQATGTIVSKK